MLLLTKLFTTMRACFCTYTLPACLGVDFSASALKIVSLKAGSLQIQRYSIAPLASGLVNAGMIQDLLPLASVLSQQSLNWSPQAVAMAIPSSIVMQKKLLLPPALTEEKLVEFIQAQLSREFASQNIAAIYAWDYARTTSEQVQVIVAKKDSLETYQALIQLAGLELAAIEVELFALYYLHQRLLREHGLMTQVLVLDLGATRLRAFVYEQAEIVLANEISGNYHQSTVELLRAVVKDVVKLIHGLKANLLIEEDKHLTAPGLIYVSGGNALLPHLISELQGFFAHGVHYFSELLQPMNPTLPADDILRLTTAIALATWGQTDATA